MGVRERPGMENNPPTWEDASSRPKSKGDLKGLRTARYAIIEQN